MSSESDPVQKSIEETKCEYVRLGKSGLKISIPILGAMSFGDPAWAPWVETEEVGLPLLKAAYDRGLNTWDTANIYSNGVSEEIIGKAIKKYNIPRAKVVILTKCFAPLGETPAINANKYPKLTTSKDYVNKGGLSRNSIFNAIDASLKRLDLEYVDLLQIHRFDKQTPIEETMEALHDVVKSGKVRYIGASSMYAYQFAMMQACAEKHGWTKFVSMQNHYSLTYREEEREMNAYCNETGVGLIPWGPLNAGRLSRPVSAAGSTTRSKEHGEMSQAMQGIINRVEELAKKKNLTMTQVALAWITPKCSSPIVGFSSVERMDEALGARGVELSEEDRKYLEELYEPRKIEGHS